MKFIKVHSKWETPHLLNANSIEQINKATGGKTNICFNDGSSMTVEETFEYIEAELLQSLPEIQ